VTSTAQVRRRYAFAVALLAAVGVLFSASTVSAAPPTPALSKYAPNEGENKTLRDQLDAAAAGYLEAKAIYEASKGLEQTLNQRMAELKQRHDAMLEQINLVAATSYRMGRLGPVTALLESQSPDDFLDRAVSVESLALQNDAQLQDLRAVRRELTQQQDRLFAELEQQKNQFATMEKKKKDAERALANAGGGANGNFVAFSSPAAQPAPRNANGTWPPESCTVDDPTTGGCLTPRTAHAYTQTKAAGFTRHVSCHRSGGSGEHPKGRACDWAAQVSGFGGVATGGDKQYGDRLASFYINNANNLGVMYVIWFRQIWFPGLGWRSYSGGGDPSSDHTNHVHLSMV
jgi:peptidoglycan DL-endopeptidase CwlO